MKKASSTEKKATTKRVRKTRVKKPVFDGPLVSIVMPAYNAEKFIDDTIHSVLGQSYENWELIIVDDHSTDKTLEVLRQFKSDKIKVIALRSNGGVAKARNRGIREARGKYLAFLDADDLWQPSKLKRQINFMQEKDCAFSFASYVFADSKGRPNGKVVRVPKMVDAFKSGMVMTSTVMLNMKKLTKNDFKLEQGKKKWKHTLEKVGCGYGMHDVMAIRGYDPKMSFFQKIRRGVR